MRRSGLESYVIVRAAGLRDSNEGLRKEIEIGQVRTPRTPRRPQWLGAR